MSTYERTMDITTASKVLHQWHKHGRHVFTRGDLARLFSEDTPKALNLGLARLIDKGLLKRACRGVYVNPLVAGDNSDTLEQIALAMRRGEYNYLSLESMLSEYGIISQIPLDRLTIMTTGRRGVYRTPWGVIEFTHTARPVEDILASTVRSETRPLRLATAGTAWRDLKRVGRNLDLVNREVLEHECQS